MNKQRGFVELFISIVIFVIIVILMVMLVKNIPKIDSSETTASPIVQEKPMTKSRCDYLGWSSESIIKEESDNGYRYTGRIVQPFCENSLSFELRDTEQENN